MSVVLLKNSCEEKKESFARDSFQDSPEDKVEWSSNLNKTTKQTEGFKEDIDWFNLSGINEDSILGDILLIFDSKSDLDNYLKQPNLYGVQLIDPLPSINAVRAKVVDIDKFLASQSLEFGPSKVDRNVKFNSPSPPEQRVLEQEKPFAGDAMNWIGANPDRINRGEGICVAILDTGVDSKHPVLNGLSVKHFSMLSDQINISSGHGTSMASIISGQAEGSLGLAPAAEIISIQVLDEQGEGDAFTVAKGIIKAVDEGADIINLSLGGMEKSRVLENAIDYAKEKELILVSASGNDGLSALAYPARYEDVIGVSSIDANGRVSSFSNYGNGVDIAAPGVGVLTAWDNDDLAYFSGTSVSSAFVTGALASEMSRNPLLSREEVLSLLYENADETEKPGFDRWTGNGILNIRRVEQREKSGIYDAALVGYYFEPENLTSLGTKPFLVSVQNQGTEWIQSMNLKVNYKGLEKTFRLGNVKPGEVKSETLYFDNGNKKELRVSAQVDIQGMEDFYPQNNSRKSVLMLP